MRILLLGEFSGVHTNLKRGLEKLGHTVTAVSNGDGFKGFAYDFQIAPFFGGGVWGKILNVLYFIKSLRKFAGYDIVQFINPFSMPYYFHFLGLTVIFKLINKRIVYYACGTDPAFLKSRSHFEYFPFDELNQEECPRYHLLLRLYYKWFIRNVNAIIPANYMYAAGYKDNKKLASPIPLPGSEILNNKVLPNGGKKNILHGITRKGFKGSGYILEAMHKIKMDYPDKVELIIVEKLPFKDYIQLFEKADVIIDQCRSYDYGMNALLALEKGKIVLSGAEISAMEYLGFKDVPIINIKPDTEQIYHELYKLVVMAEDEIWAKKNSSIAFARQAHGNGTISKMFADFYKRVLRQT